MTQQPECALGAYQMLRARLYKLIIFGGKIKIEFNMWGYLVQLGGSSFVTIKLQEAVGRGSLEHYSRECIRLWQGCRQYSVSAHDALKSHPPGPLFLWI